MIVQTLIQVKLDWANRSECQLSVVSNEGKLGLTQRMNEGERLELTVNITFSWWQRLKMVFGITPVTVGATP